MAKRWTHECDSNCDRLRLRVVHEHAHRVFQDAQKAKLKGKRIGVRATTRSLRFVRPAPAIRFISSGEVEVR